jgi:hypothetical protein
MPSGKFRAKQVPKRLSPLAYLTPGANPPFSWWRTISEFVIISTHWRHAQPRLSWATVAPP